MEVQPQVLEFTGSFTKQTTEYLTLSNPTNTPLAFKVKTTAPKLYCVRPNASVIQPGGSLDISIILQGFSQPLPQDYKCKDKFLLVSLPAPHLSDPSKVGEQWSQLEAQHKSQLVSKKLRVNYVIGPDKEDSGAAAGGIQQQQHQPPAQQQQQQQQPTQHQQVANENHYGGAAAIGGGGALAGAAIGSHAQQHAPQHAPQQVNGDQSFNNDRSFNDTSSQYNGYNANTSGYQQYQQQPQLHQQHSYQFQPQQSYQSQQQQQQPSPELQRELEALARQVQTLSTKLDQNERKASANPVTSLVSNESGDVNGLSLPVALVLILIAFLIGWLVF